MNKKVKGSHKVDTVFVLMIFCVFAVSVLVVLMLGGSTYKNMIDISKDGYEERTGLSYIRTKVRNLDSEGKIMVYQFGGESALCFAETFGERAYETLIYFRDGWIYEVFHEQGYELNPEEGTPIVRTDSLYFEEKENGLIRVSTDYGSLLILPRSTASTDQLIREGF